MPSAEPAPCVHSESIAEGKGFQGKTIRVFPWLFDCSAQRAPLPLPAAGEGYEPGFAGLSDGDAVRRTRALRAH